MLFSTPPGSATTRPRNGGVVPYTLCHACYELPDACDRIAQALEARGKGKET